mgnify:CR=1 FL=1|jgi:hypothetical protein
MSDLPTAKPDGGPAPRHEDGAEPRDDLAELLDDGQEEVFSRTAVELGRIEHHPSEES